MTAVTVIGTGTMGTAIAGIAERAGATVQPVAHSDTGVQVNGDVVVLAVPYPAVDDVLATYGDQLAGRTVVDITNPLDPSTFDSLVVPPDGSAAREIASRVPQARVVKAFNTTFAATLSSGTLGGRPTTVLMAGDDAGAKAELAALVEGAGLKALDAGSLARARELESLGLLQITLAAAEKLPWTGGFAVAG